jgi:hypothetical protein
MHRKQRSSSALEGLGGKDDGVLDSSPSVVLLCSM